jgi:hypothetical protein
MVGTINPHIGLSPTSNHPCWAHIKKPFSLIAKGLESLGSPGCSIYRTFIYQFYFQAEVKKASTPKKRYKNPIYLAKEYKELIDSRAVKDQTEMARIKGISRARVTQILNLLKLDKSILYELEKLGDPINKKLISERKLRKNIKKLQINQFFSSVLVYPR